MKAVTAPLAALEGSALPLAADSTEKEDAAPAEGFDALLALVNAQTASAAAPVKVMAPSVGVQCAPAAQAKDAAGKAATAAKAQASKSIDLAPTQDFLPWLNMSASPTPHVAPQAAAAASDAPAALLEVPVSEPQPTAAVAEVAVSDAVIKAPRVNMAAPPVALLQNVESKVAQAATPAQAERASATPEPASHGASKSAPPPRKANVRAQEERAENTNKPAPLPASTPQTLAQLTAAPAEPMRSAPVQAPNSSSGAQSTVAPAQAKPATSEVRAVTSDEAATVDADMFGQLLTVEREASAPEAPTAQATAATSVQLEAEVAQPVSAPKVAAPMPTSNPDTGARVTKIEFFTSEAPAVSSQPAQGELNLVVAKAEGDGLEGTSAKAHGERSSDGETADQQEPAQDAPVPALESSAARTVSAPRFEVTEGKGMRGLDAVVASLLRPYTEKSEAKSGARAPTASAPHVSIETGKSQNVKVEERAANIAQTFDAGALRREDEERRADVRERVEVPQPHFQHHVDLPVDTPADATPAPSAPMNAPAPPPPDPDAAMMGKIARGESLNAAVSIEHPELGSMDVLVENQNGRIDVRATLETPRAAAVLRAHESALRYGVQQAGMTFGALRVNARTGDTKAERSRDVTNRRRRDRDWEA